MAFKDVCKLILLSLCLYFGDSANMAQGLEIDVVLLIDSSDSYRSSDFDHEKRFALAFANQIYGQDTRIGLITFGANAYSQFTLDAYSDIEQMRQAIQYMWFSTGDGKVAPAIEYAITNGFDDSSGDRECVANTMVVLTHSSISEATVNERLKKLAESKRIRYIFVNMAGTSAASNFATLANSSSRVIDINSFTALDASSSKVVNIVQTDLPYTGCGKFSDWGVWSKCSVSCDKGLMFRTRMCIKNDISDKDCEGPISDEMVCSMTNCTEPVDGIWSDWGVWQTCSKTCDGGVQRRIRLCDRPEPRNGGAACPGAHSQERKCSEWTCPDCNKTCPPGSHLSKDCGICECSSVTLFGQIMDNTKHPVEGADIFLESGRYKPLATTDRFGQFSKVGVCLTNEQIYIQAPNCQSKHLTPSELNATHWTLVNSTLERYVLAGVLTPTVAPVITIQPHDKVRMVGQSFTLCCAAVGMPMPSSYKWFRNDIEMVGVGLNGSIAISSAQKSDAGSYYCYTETAAGVTLSEKIKIDIQDNKEDTCGAPLEKLQDLPAGCFLTSDITRNNTIDIGECGKALCIRSSLQDNGSCSDYWPHHCCNPKDVEVLDISCTGFSYKTTRVKSCECKPCVFKTVISGRAIGRKNESDVPFQVGQIIVNGKVMATTNAAGFFKFEVPKGTKRIVATFHDNIFKRFMDITKIIQVNEGGDTFASVVVPLRPTPIPFNSDNGTEIHLGGGQDNKQPAASISIPTDSIVTPDGKPYIGPAKATIHFMDPRNKDDIEAANGDFESETPGGEKLPLKTFGMFQLGVEDDKGNQLKVNKPMKFSLDAALFNIPHDDKGDPDLSLWNYDNNKGIWVETAKMRYEQDVHGRKLLAAGNLVAEIEPRGVPEIDQYGTHVEQVWTGRYTNCDHSVKIYDSVVVRDSQPKAGACFVSVSVYKDLSLREAYTGGDIAIKTYVKELDNSSYIGAHTQRVLEKGHACIPVFCDKLIDIHVVRNGKERFYEGNHYLPHRGYIKKTINNTVYFESRDYGVSLDCSGPLFKPGSTCRGPMYQFMESAKCSRETFATNGFQFKFAPFTKAPTHNFVAGEGKYNERLSWYPVSPDQAAFRSCFVKLRIDLKQNYDLRLLGKSHLKSVNGDEFGSYDVGPTPDPRTDDHSIRGACIEFRCPGYLLDGGKELFNEDTAVDVYIITPNTALNCTISKTNPLLTITPNYVDSKNPQNGVTGFQFVAAAGINYGSRYGIFISDSPPNEVEQFCASGYDRGPHVDGLMNPKISTAVELVCT